METQDTDSIIIINNIFIGPVLQMVAQHLVNEFFCWGVYMHLIDFGNVCL